MRILATSTETVAFIAAAAALLGGVLGAIAGGLSEYFLERHRNKTKARAGARLVRSELLKAAEQMWISEESCAWKYWFDFSIKTWDAYGDVLASELDPDRWASVDEAVRNVRAIGFGIEELNRKFGEAPAPELALEASSVAGFSTQRKELQVAHDALARLAKGATSSGEFGKPKELEQ